MDPRLAQAGLTERDIFVLSRFYSDRDKTCDIGEDLGISRAGANNILRRAVAKLRKAGLPEPKRQGDDIRNRPQIISMDPHLLDLMPAR